MGYLETLTDTAKKYIGQCEIPQNQGWVDKDLDARFRKLGFENGQSWCAYFVELVCNEVYVNSKWLPELKRCLSPSTQTMYGNFAASPDFHVSRTPKLGSIVVWQDGNLPQGHTGIVTSIGNGVFTSVEGNTSATGSSNGDRVWENKHNLVFTENGFHLRGFVWLPDTDDLSTVQEYKQSLTA